MGEGALKRNGGNKHCTDKLKQEQIKKILLFCWRFIWLHSPQIAGKNRQSLYLLHREKKDKDRKGCSMCGCVS
jgi:hypothetical protein